MSTEEKQNFQTYQDSDSIEYPKNEKEASSFIKKFYKSGIPIELIGSGSKKKIGRSLQCAKTLSLSKLDGIICSGQEVSYIKKICKKMEIITPGIRLVGEKKHDQKRVMTPRKAFEEGATAIVIGRSITKGNIKKNFTKLIQSLN